MKRRLLDIINRFADANIAVLGDMTVDIYIYARPHRLSREAPVVIVQYEDEEMMPGGAANVVANLCRLGARVLPIGVLGDDDAGHAVLDSFPPDRVDKEGFVFERDRATVTKTRVLAGDAHTSKQQMLRVDKEATKPIISDTEQRILALLDHARESADALIVSDYGYDVTTPAVRAKLADIARQKTVLVDSRYRIPEFKGATVIKPNEAEARTATGIRGGSDEDVYDAGRRLLDSVASRAVVLTRGNKGMVVFEKEKEPAVVPICNTAHVTGITDVSGAGDTVGSLLGLSLACGASCLEAAQLATYAAAVVVTKRGVSSTTTDELLGVVEKNLGENS